MITLLAKKNINKASLKNLKNILICINNVIAFKYYLL